jgi:hypothetical protein
MVTVIRPSRARCVNTRIPRHERAVVTLKKGRRMACFVGLMRGEIIPSRCNQPAAGHLRRLRDRGGDRH